MTQLLFQRFFKIHKFYWLLIGCLLSTTIYGQKTSVSLELDYAFNGSNNILIGPGIVREPAEMGRTTFFTSAAGGVVWNYQDGARPASEVIFSYGWMPGIMLGIGTQQYYGLFNNLGIRATDVRASAEVAIVFFGYLAYRFQYPVIRSQKSPNISMHSFVVRLPIPVKHLNKGK